jgi:hypothetical protein
MYDYGYVGLFSDGGSIKLKRNIAIDNKSELAYMIGIQPNRECFPNIYLLPIK